jgi:hypothetical protein
MSRSKVHPEGTVARLVRLGAPTARKVDELQAWRKDRHGADTLRAIVEAYFAHPRPVLLPSARVPTGVVLLCPRCMVGSPLASPTGLTTSSCWLGTVGDPTPDRWRCPDCGWTSEPVVVIAGGWGPR